MALTVTSRGTGTHNTAATTLVPGGRSATLAVGSLGVLAMALDNAGSAGANTCAPASWTDAQGNVWTAFQNALYDNGAASAGIEMVFYTAPITVALLTTDAGTMTFRASPTAKAWTWYEVIPTSGFYAAYQTGGTIAGATAANAQVTTASIAVGDAVIAGYFSENVAAVTGDSDTTNGTWTAEQTATIGSTTSGVRIATQQKVQTTAASTQSYDVTVASQDRIAGYIAIHEAAVVTNAPAGLASGTGAAFAPTITIFPAWGAWSATWSNPASSGGTNAAAEVVTGTGLANNAAPSLAPNAANVAGTGLANGAAANVKSNAGLTSGTGAANNAGRTVAPNAGAATGTGTANAATVTTSGAATNASAGLASGTGAAGSPTANVKPGGGLATGTGETFSGSGSTLAVDAGNASGTGTAYNPTVTTGSATNATAGTASGTGTAQTVAATVAPRPTAGAGTGAANNATVLVGTQAAAGAAIGTGSALVAATKVAASAGVAQGTGAAYPAIVTESSNAFPQVATGSGQANAAAAKVVPSGGLATGTGAARDATVTSSSGTNAAAGTTSGSGAANGASVKIAASAGNATGIGAAYGAIVTESSNTFPGTATGTGAALDAHGSPSVTVGRAAGSGQAYDATVTTTTSVASANAGVAAGTGQAFDATVQLSMGGRGGRVLVGRSIPPRMVRPRAPKLPPIPVYTYANAQTARGNGRAYPPPIEWDDDETAILLLLGVLA